jgi:hypothetical protein
MMFFNRDSAIQSAYRRFCTVYKSENLVPCQPSGWRGIPSGSPSVQSIIRPDNENFPSRRPSVSRSFEQVQGCIRPDVMANRPDTLQSSRRSQCSKAFVRATWLYRPDTIQCLTSIKVSSLRHSYGKTAATVWRMCDPVRTMSSIRQDVHTKFNRPNITLQGPNVQSLIMVITCSWSVTVRTLGQHCPDARATPSRRGLNMEVFSAILERRSQLTVLTLGQVVRTPSSILIITFWSNVGLGSMSRLIEHILN